MQVAGTENGVKVDPEARTREASLCYQLHGRLAEALRERDERLQLLEHLWRHHGCVDGVGAELAL